MKRILYFSAFALSVFIIFGCSDANDLDSQDEIIRPVKSIKLGEAEDGSRRRFPARVFASRRAELSFRVPGKIVKMPVKEGDRVKKGDLLASLDPADYRIAVQDKQGQFKRAEADFRRAKLLVKQGHISRMDFDRLESSYTSSKAALKKAQQDLAYTKLKAPFDGTIARRYLENYEEVSARQPVFSLQSTTDIDVKFDLPEYLLLKIKRATSEEEVRQRRKREEPFAFAYFGDQQKAYPLKFKEIATRADPRTRTFEVTFTMKSPQELTVLAGMSAEVVLEMSRIYGAEENIFYVPVTAVFSKPEDTKKTYVWLVNEETMQVESREVTAGEVQGDSIEITSGLEGNERIVTAGVHHLHAGQKVHLMSGKIGD